MDGRDVGGVELLCILEPAERYQVAPDPLAELRRRCLGECHCHDALWIHQAIDNPLPEFVLQGMRLARAGARGDDREQWQRQQASLPSSGRVKRPTSGLFSSA